MLGRVSIDEGVALANGDNAQYPALTPAVTWQYVSRDGGRQWRYSAEFAGIPG